MPKAVRTVGGPGHAGLYGWGAATMWDGSVLIGDYWNYRVVHYAKDGTRLGDFINNPGYAPEKHQAPYGLGVDPTNGDVYMADTDRRGVDKYDKDGKFLLSFGTGGDGANKFKYPSRVAVASDGRVYVVDTWSHLISVHDPDGTELFAFGGFGTGNGQMKQPHGAAFDGQDRLFVADTMNHRVQVFDTAGNFLFAFGSKGTDPGQFAGDIRGLAVDKARAWVYVVDAHGNRVSKFDIDGNYLLRWGSTGTDRGQFSDGGREITVDGDGNVWVGDMPNFRAQKFSSTGDFLLLVPDPPEPPPPGGFNGPRGVAVDSQGNLFVTDTYNQRVEKFAPDGTFLLQWGSRGRADYAFNYPRMIAVDPRTDHVVVADTDNHKVRKYDNDGLHLWSVGSGGSGSGQFRNPHGVDVAADGAIVVADTRNKRVVVLDENGAFLRAFGTEGTGNGQFKYPRGIGMDPNDGTVWVADSVRKDVQHFSITGEFLGKFGTAGTAADQFYGPFDVEVDDTYVYVADARLHEIKVWTRTGTFVTSFGGPGTKLGKLKQPQGLDLDSKGRLYVTEQKNERVQEWSVREGSASAGSLTYQRTLGGPGHAEMYPSGMEIAPDGSVLVADTGNNQVKKYAATGALVWAVGDWGSGTGEFANPRDVGVDSSGNVYVADTTNRRVVKLAPDGSWLTSWQGPDGDRIATPMGLSVTGDLVYVADASRKRVRVFDASGSQLRSFTGQGDCAFAPLRDVDADPAGNVYVANYTNNNIVKTDSAGACVTTWGTKGTADGQFKNPYGVRIAYDPVTGADAVYVADSNNGRIQVFDTSGGFIAKAGKKGSAATDGEFDSLRRVAVATDGAGDVWAADMWGWKLQRFARTSDGYAYAQTIGSGGPPLLSDAVFNEVRGISFDSAGNVHAVDTVNQRIVRMSPTGSVLNTCGRRGWTLGEYNWPRGVSVDQATGEIWVADTKQNLVHVIQPDCTGLLKFGGYGSGSSQFNWPHSIAIRQTDRIAWIADTRNHRVKSYDVATRELIATFGSFGTDSGNFKHPRGIAVNPTNGRILVADYANDRVVELTDNAGSGVSVTRVLTGFKRPQGVAADSAGRIYVADTGNNRVAVLDADGTVLTTVSDGFDQPETVTVDDNDLVYVADTFNDRIVVYSFG